MKATHSCRLLISRLSLPVVNEITDEIADALYEAGCDDGSPFSSEGVVAVGFSREAPTIEEAVRSAIADVNKAGFSVARVESADEPVFTKINREQSRVSRDAQRSA